MSRTPVPTWLFALIAGIFWAVSLGFFAFGREEQENSRAFMSVARPAMGKFVGYVIWKEREPGLRGRVRDRTNPEIEFETETGQKVRFVAASAGNTMFEKRKSEYPVLYDPSNPSRAQLDAGLDEVFWIIYLCAVTSAISGAVFTILWLRRLSA